jgi:hypothetical protein
LFGDVASQTPIVAVCHTSAVIEVNLVKEIPMSLGGIPTPGGTELFDVITVLCSRPGMLCVRDHDEPNGREAIGIDVASFANLAGNGAVLRRRSASERDGPLVDHRFNRFRPPWTAVALVGVDGIEAAVDRQQRGQLAR